MLAKARLPGSLVDPSQTIKVRFMRELFILIAHLLVTWQS
jgi:hypothetical protein